MLISFLKVIKIMRKLSALHYSLSRLGLPFAEGITIISQVEIRKQRDPHIPPRFKTSTWGLASSQFEFSHLDSERKKAWPTELSPLYLHLLECIHAFFLTKSAHPRSCKKNLWSKKLVTKLKKKVLFLFALRLLALSTWRTWRITMASCNFRTACDSEALTISGFCKVLLGHMSSFEKNKRQQSQQKSMSKNLGLQLKLSKAEHAFWRASCQVYSRPRLLDGWRNPSISTTNLHYVLQHHRNLGKAWQNS